MSITLIIVLLTAIVSILAFNNQQMKGRLLFWPYGIKRNGQYYRFLSYGLVHADFVHLAFNMLTLFSIGSYVEGTDVFSAEYRLSDNGRMYYLIMYVTALIVSTIPDYFKYKDNENYLALGASGAVSAVLFSFIILQPTRVLSIFFFLPMPGYLFGILFLVFSAYMARRGGDNIGHAAHFYGALYGIAFTWIVMKLFSRDRIDVLQEFIQQVWPR